MSELASGGPGSRSDHPGGPRRRLPGLLFLGSCGLVLCPSLRADTQLLDGFADVRVASGLRQPMAMTFAPDGRLFVCEQAGRLRVIVDGALLPDPILDIGGAVDGSVEKGLLAVAFDPDFESNPHVYVYYTALSPYPHNRVSRFTADGEALLPESEVVLIELEAPSIRHHGGMVLGPDGRLWIGTGDNGNPDDAQSLDNPHGKILRFATDGSIPLSNPFYYQTTGINRAIWALGLRNPFSFAFHPESGRLFVNDVGQDGWEEVDDGYIGANYGWPLSEGPSTDPSLRAPVLAYPHAPGPGAPLSGKCVLGAVFFAPASSDYPEAYRDAYFFADHSAKWIKSLDPGDGYRVTDFVSGDGSFRPIDLDLGPDGNLYYLTRGGQVHRIEYLSTHLPVITRHPQDGSIPEGQPFSLEVGAFGDSLSFQWEKDQAPIRGGTEPTLAALAVEPADAGTYRCVVSNPFGTAVSDPATLVVTPFDLPPKSAIFEPRPLTTYAGGQTFRFHGTATDPEEGLLEASALSWRLDFHHDEHVHDSPPFAVGTQSGSFTLPALGETATDVWYRLSLTATDSAGLSDTSHVDLFPSVVELTLTTDPPGLGVFLDGQPTATPAVVRSVVGIQRTLGAAPAPSGSVFLGWTGATTGLRDPATTHTTLSTPPADATITARYSRPEVAPKRRRASLGKP